MADISDELDALFDDEETEQEEAVEEAVAEEEAEAAEAAKADPKGKVKAKIGSKIPVKNSKTTGARTGSIPIGKKAAQGGALTRPADAKPGKAEAAPEPEPAAPTRSVRGKAAPAPAGGGKGLLVVSLVLNVVLLVAVMVTMLKVGGLATDIEALKGDMKTELTSVKNVATSAANSSRFKMGVVVDPKLGQQAVVFLVPSDATKSKTQTKAWSVDLRDFLRNGEPGE